MTFYSGFDPSYTVPPPGTVATQEQLAAYVPTSKSASNVVEGALLFAYGDSLTGAAVLSTGGGAGFANVRWIDRVVRRLGSATSLLESTTEISRIGNRAVNGWRAPDGCLYAFGSFTAQAGGNATAVAGTWSASPLNRGVVIPWFGRNDAGWDGLGGTSAQHKAGFQNAMVALMRLVRASAITPDTNAAFAYGANWTAQSGSTFLSGGTGHFTTTAGATVTITTPVGTDFDLILIAFDSAVSTGAAFTITVDGAAWTPAGYPTTTQNQMQSSGGSSQNQGFCQMAVPLHGLTNQAHTVVLTHAGTTGQLLEVNCLLTQSPTPMTIIIPKIFHLPAAGYATYTSGGSASANSATDDAYNAIIDTIVGLFPNDGSVQTWDPNTAGWLPVQGAGGHLSSQDSQGLHPNDAGMAFIADGIMGVLNGLPARLGLVTV